MGLPAWLAAELTAGEARELAAALAAPLPPAAIALAAGAETIVSRRSFGTAGRLRGRARGGTELPFGTVGADREAVVLLESGKKGREHEKGYESQDGRKGGGGTWRLRGRGRGGKEKKGKKKGKKYMASGYK